MDKPFVYEKLPISTLGVTFAIACMIEHISRRACLFVFLPWYCFTYSSNLAKMPCFTSLERCLIFFINSASMRSTSAENKEAEEPHFAVSPAIKS